jgi:hypothetical protein
MLHHHPHKRPDALQLHEQLELYLKTLS